jgi:HlyD family type I secretion membrane fusion protein
MKSESRVADAAIKYGIRSLLVFAIIFLTWAAFLPINSASIADGVIILDFNRKTIQHLEGGIIDQILVKEGQLVKQDDVLLYIHDIKAQSEQQILKERLWAMQLQKQRLVAEKEGKQFMEISDFLSSIGEVSLSDENVIKEIANNQIKLFKSKKDKQLGEVRVLDKKLKSAQVRLAILKEELSLIKPLVDEKNLPISQEFELQKSISEMQFEADAARLQIANYQNEQLSETLKEIKETDMEIVGLFNQLNELKDVVERTAIVAPTSGKVMNIKYHTISAVVPPGGEIMDIVPQNEELIIEARVKPEDIDNIAIGLKAKVSLTAYKGKKVPKINGEVINVSPDIVTNEQTRESYFLARIKINKNDIKKLKHKVELYPGMPAQVFIITGSRSLISYMLEPITDSAYKAFRED